jgi:hypothetical protein
VLPVKDDVERWRAYFVKRGKDWSAQTFAELLDEHVIVVAGVF